MSDIAHSLVRRAVHVTQQHYATESNGDEDQIKRIATWGIVLLWATTILYMALIAAVSLSFIPSVLRLRLDLWPADFLRHTSFLTLMAMLLPLWQ